MGNLSFNIQKNNRLNACYLGNSSSILEKGNRTTQAVSYSAALLFLTLDFKLCSD